MNASQPRWRAAIAVTVALCLVVALSSVALAKPKASDPSLRGSWSLDEGTGTVANAGQLAYARPRRLAIIPRILVG